jgi:hypothetical protein
MATAVVGQNDPTEEVREVCIDAYILYEMCAMCAMCACVLRLYSFWLEFCDIVFVVSVLHCLLLSLLMSLFR